MSSGKGEAMAVFFHRLLKSLFGDNEVFQTICVLGFLILIGQFMYYFYTQYGWKGPLGVVLVLVGINFLFSINGLWGFFIFMGLCIILSLCNSR